MALIVSVEEYRAYVGIASDADDARLGALIEAVQAQAQAYCYGHERWTFDQRTYTDQPFDGTGAATLHLRAPNVTAVTAVKYRDDAGNLHEQDLSRFRADQDASLLHILGAHTGRFVSDDFGVRREAWGTWPCFPRGVQNVLVTFTAGWSVDDPDERPANLKLAMYEAISDAYQAVRGGGGIGPPSNVKSANLGQFGYTVASAQEIEAIVARRFSRFRSYA